jgi:hypothetical protein
MGSDGGALGGGALTGGSLTGGASICCALGGGAPTGGGFTRGADCVDRESAGSGSVGSLASGRSMSSVANRLAKKAVSAKTTSAGVSIFRADASGARLLESGGRFLDMGNG